MNSHDEIADIMGVTTKSFEETYKDKSNELKRTLLEYIKTLRAIKVGTGAGAGAVSSLDIRVNPRGFPMAPCPPSWEKISKDTLEGLFHKYISLHYRERHMPKIVIWVSFIFYRSCLQGQETGNTFY